MESKKHDSGAPDYTIATWKGHTIDLSTGPKPEQVDIEDIAHSLSMQCRFCGHPKRFYSIAEHAVYAAMMAPKIYALYFLSHDNHEYCYHDLSSPLKRLLFGVDKRYKNLCDNADETIIEGLGLSIIMFRKLQPDIKEIDRKLLKFEQSALFGPSNLIPQFPADHPLKNAPFGMTPEEAEASFLDLYYSLKE